MKKAKSDSEIWEKENNYRKCAVDNFNCRCCKHLIVELGNRDKANRCKLRRDAIFEQGKKMESFVERDCTCNLWEKWEKPL